MNKKEYMIPTCEVVELEMVSMIATSPSIGVGGSTDEDFTEDANRHRGEWGNLWNR